MEKAIESNIVELCESMKEEQKAGEKMQVAQAILNLTHALATLNNIK